MDMLVEMIPSEPPATSTASGGGGGVRSVSRFTLFAILFMFWCNSLPTTRASFSGFSLVFKIASPPESIMLTLSRSSLSPLKLN